MVIEGINFNIVQTIIGTTLVIVIVNILMRIKIHRRNRLVELLYYRRKLIFAGMVSILVGLLLKSGSLFIVMVIPWLLVSLFIGIATILIFSEPKFERIHGSVEEEATALIHRFILNSDQFLRKVPNSILLRPLKSWIVFLMIKLDITNKYEPLILYHLHQLNNKRLDTYANEYNYQISRKQDIEIDNEQIMKEISHLLKKEPSFVNEVKFPERKINKIIGILGVPVPNSIND